MIKKIFSAIILLTASFKTFAYQNSGVVGVDKTNGYGYNIGMSLLFLVGIAAIIKGVSKLINEQGSGKAVAAMYIGVGVVAFGVMGIWTSQMSGFSF